MCIWFRNSSFPSENFAPDLLILLILNCSTIYCRLSTSLLWKTPEVSLRIVGSSLWGGFQPRRATPFRTASGKKSLSLYDCTETSPNRLDSFYPLSFSNKGKWANSGKSSCSILYRITCLGVDGSHSYSALISIRIAYLSSDDMTDAHHRIVNHIREMIGRISVIFENDLVVYDIMIKYNFAMNQILEHCLSFGYLHADDVWFTVVHFFLHLLLGVAV